MSSDPIKHGDIYSKAEVGCFRKGARVGNKMN